MSDLENEIAKLSLYTAQFSFEELYHLRVRPTARTEGKNTLNNKRNMTSADGYSRSQYVCFFLSLFMFL